MSLYWQGQHHRLDSTGIDRCGRRVAEARLRRQSHRRDHGPRLLTPPTSPRPGDRITLLTSSRSAAQCGGTLNLSDLTHAAIFLVAPRPNGRWP